MLSNIRPVILCGGSGTRLWPLSRESFPKQFVPLINGQSLLELTINRVKNFGTPICVTNEEHRFFVQDLMRSSVEELANTAGSILLEPSGRNTAAAMSCAALMPIVKPTDVLLFLPADHFVPDADAFIETIETGIAAANSGYIVTFGVQPTAPSTAYGYIQQDDTLLLDGKASSDVFKVARFVEKPPVDEAHRMLLTGGYYWNAGIFLCQAKTLIQAMEKHAPDIMKSCASAMNVSQMDGNFIRPDQNEFLACRSESIDYAVMERFDAVVMAPFRGVWSDVGSWNAVAELSSADESGNRINGQGIAVQSNNTYINAPHRPVIALGTSNLIIVDTSDAVLVASVDKVEEVKQVVALLKQEGAAQAVTHRKVARPWGWYDSIDRGQTFQVKRICVKAGASLSLQFHHHRAEHWIVVKGLARVTNGEQVFLLKENESTYIPIGAKHRLENPGEIDLEMIEVQSGSYLGEDDIVRLEDSYGRN